VQHHNILIDDDENFDSQLSSYSCLGCTFYSSNDEYSATDTESGNLYIPLKEDHSVGEVVHTMNVYPRSVD
jgi:hypothetical protein